MSTVELLAIGETMVMVTPEAGSRLAADSRYLLHPGGAESNVAAHLARMGHRVAWGSAVGDDPLGDIVVDSLREAGVDTDTVQRDPLRQTAVYFKDPTVDGTRVFYYRSGSAASALDIDSLESWVAIAPRMVHLSGITPALSESCRDLTRTVIHRRAFGDAVISFDVNHRPALWREGASGELLDLARASDIVFVGLDEAERLWGSRSAEEVRGLVPSPAALVVKDGPREVVSFLGDETTREPAREVPVVDVVGAGDAFAAGWLSGYLDGRSARTRLRMGHYVASRVVMSPSDAAPLPVAREIATEVDRVF
ncbi:MAG: kdgK [Frondihabitans sp.]|nr:kdgK [Frondihabitans sp.]